MEKAKQQGMEKQAAKDAAKAKAAPPPTPMPSEDLAEAVRNRPWKIKHPVTGEDIELSEWKPSTQVAPTPHDPRLLEVHNVHSAALARGRVGRRPRRRGTVGRYNMCM